MESISLITLALRVISERLLTLCSLFLSFVLACWTMIDPAYERLVMAMFFAAFSYLIIAAKERNQNARPENP